jgi:hypothetical protein
VRWSPERGRRTWTAAIVCVLGREKVEVECWLHTTMIHGYVLISVITFNLMAHIHSHHSHISLPFS